MGVMLALDKPRARLRRRGQHSADAGRAGLLRRLRGVPALRRAECRALAVSRLATTVLASRLLPAARALADAVDLVLAEQTLAAPVTYDAAVGASARASPGPRHRPGRRARGPSR